ncbi:MAG: hypothetical protein Kow0098_18210 [Ignavibacteriaceae bacterium]
MRILSFIFFITFLSVNLVFGQLNVELKSNLDLYPTKDYNDIWGYVDQSGNEYALLGVEHGTSIILINDPENPVEVAFIPGPNSVWRDIKVHDHYAYTVTEGTSTGTGLQIIDLSNLPNSAQLVNTVTTWFTSAHNLFIDDGFAYVVGTGGGGGIHILDLTDPVNPVRTAYYTQSNYVHDVYVYNDTIVVAGGDTYDLVDATNKSNPQMISSTGSATPPGIYAHSGWMTDDKRYFFATEEFDVRDIIVYDLIDRTTWETVVPSWQMTGSSPVHNLFIRNNWAYISYYKHGLVVLNITDPLNPVLEGWYDTYPSSSGFYDGAWGCYPYLPSGNILISDISSGLWILDFLPDGITPVELNSFTANIIDNNVQLNWSTSTETNNSGFNIESLTDKHNWRNIAFIPGFGTTTNPQHYTYTDRNPLPGINYYRLVQIDFDGTKKYYDPVEVTINSPASFKLEQNFPNPFNPSTKIEFSLPSEEHVSLKIFNSLGENVAELINETLNAGTHQVTFDAKNLPTGIYIAKLETGSFIKSIKMTLLK